MLTLVGPGGVGKTRVAIAAAGALGDEFPDGVAFLDLSPLRDARLVPATIAQGLDVREMDGRSARTILVDELREQRMLLVLDNFEHVLDASSVVAEILNGCPLLRVLVTSRLALRLRAEHRHLAPGLGFPHVAGLSVAAIDATPAVRLLVERAQAVVPDRGGS